jgi:hypothetical protein
VRAALLPEDATEFDRQWQDVVARAARELDLREVHRTLNLPAAHATSAGSPPVTATSSPKFVGNTACGMPPAAHTSS